MYGPVHLLPLLLFKWKHVLQNPQHAAFAWLRSVGWSIAFLLTYGNVVKFSLCGLRHIHGCVLPVTVTQLRGRCIGPCRCYESVRVLGGSHLLIRDCELCRHCCSGACMCMCVWAQA